MLDTTTRPADRLNVRGVRRALRAMFAAALLVLTAAGTAATPALATSPAGQYDIWSCHNGSGTSVSTTGWSSAVNGSGFDLQATASCGAQDNGVDGIYANFGGTNGANVIGTQNARWTFRPPAGTHIVGATLARHWIVTQNRPPGTEDPAYVSPGIQLQSGGTDFFNNDVENCQAYYGPAQCYTNPTPTVSVGGGGDDSYSFYAGCIGNTDRSCQDSDLGRAGYTVTSARTTLRDDTDPTVVGETTGNPFSGPGANGAPLSGATSVQFDVTDTGSGVLATQAWIDSTQHQVQALKVPASMPSVYSACVIAGRSAGFNDAVPCPVNRVITPTIEFSTVGLASGSHTLYVDVSDASGNVKHVKPLSFTVAATPTPTPTPAPATSASPTPTPVPVGTGTAKSTPTPGAGSLASDPAPAPAVVNGVGGDRATAKFVPDAKKQVIAVRYGKAVKLSGHLVDAAGKPITGATIDVRSTLGLPGSVQSATTTVQTDAKGAYTYRFTAQSSRTISLGYAPTLGSTLYTAQSVVGLHTAAGVSLRITRKAIGVGGSATFSGAVSVDPQPAGGSRVLIEGKKPGGDWVLAAALKTDAHGAFSWTHRFRLRGSWQFRARVLGSVDLAARPASSSLRPLRIG